MTVEPSAPSRFTRIGVVSYLNTLPLIDGLDDLDNFQLQQSVPSLLLQQLLDDEVAIALCSSIDYQRCPAPLQILPAGMLGCDGPTLTVRLFCSVPVHRISAIHCDTDSHTSIALLRVLLHELHGIEPELIDYDAREHVAGNRPVTWPEAMLLIGDKVVTDSTPAIRYPYQMDLGAQWSELTDLPFVFALWMAKKTAQYQSEQDHYRLRTATAALDHQRRHNCQRIENMIARRARLHNWPNDLARTYLKDRLRYEFTPRAIESLNLFFEKCHQLGVTEKTRPLHILGKNNEQLIQT